MMKILLVNYRYFISGGPERYLFNFKKMYEDRGHEIVPFSIHYSKNVESEYSKYFVSPLGSADQVYFKEQKSNFSTIRKTISRLFYSKEVENSLDRLIIDESPDVAYVLHFLRKLSPSVLASLKKNKIPVVVRLSDFTMFCPQAHCLRDGISCFDCIDGKLFNSVKYKCVQNSYPASILNYLATKYHQMKGYFDLIDYFVTTNNFSYNLFLKAGFPEDKLKCIETFYDSDVFYKNKGEENNSIVYLGRLDSLKGCHVLLESLIKIKKLLKSKNISINIIGEGDESYIDNLNSIVNENLKDIDINFLGPKNSSEICHILNESMASVVPSLCNENLPNSLIESYACGTPVLASDIGSLSINVLDGKTGFLFEAGNSTSLAEKLESLINDKNNQHVMSDNALRFAQEHFSREVHYEKLLKIFTSLNDCSEKA